MRGDDSRQRGKYNQRNDERIGNQTVKRVGHVRRMTQKMRSLPEIVQQQRGQSEGEPGEPDRPAAEMPEVRIECLTASHNEEDRTKHEVTTSILAHEKTKRMNGIQGRKDLWSLPDRHNSHHRNDREPKGDDRTEEHTHAGRADALNREQAYQNNDGDGQDP